MVVSIIHENVAVLWGWGGVRGLLVWLWVTQEHYFSILIPEENDQGYWEGDI